MKDEINHMQIHMMLNQVVHLSRYQAVKQLQKLGLKPSQAGILFTLSRTGHMSQKELAERIGITPPSMTVALRKMENQGYVTKEPDQNDQRVIRIMLTEKGKDCIGNIVEVASQMEEVVYRGISPEERMLLQRLLEQMRQNLLKSREFKGMNEKDINTFMSHARMTIDDRI